MLHSALKLGRVVAVLFYLGASCFITRAEPAAVGQLAPAWQLTDLDGRVVRSTDFAGKVVLLNVFRTTCVPCTWEIPDLVSLQNQYGPQGLVVIGIGAQQSADELRAFATEQHINYLVCPSNDALLWDYNVFPLGAIPLTTLIDRNGLVVDWYRYYQERAYHEERVLPLLAPAMPPLTVTHSGARIDLSWPTNASSFVLEATPDWMSGNTWQELTNTVVISNGVHRVRLNAQENAAFFRLRKTSK